MTMPYGTAEEPTVEQVQPKPIPVHVASSDAKGGRSIAAEFGYWRSFIFSTSAGPNSAQLLAVQRIASRSPRRRRLHIIVNASIAAQTVTDGVMIGNREQITSGNVQPPGFGTGGYLQIGDSIRWECQAELWACLAPGSAAAVYLTVGDEVYASDAREE